MVISPCGNLCRAVQRTLNFNVFHSSYITLKSTHFTGTHKESLKGTLKQSLKGTRNQTLAGTLKGTLNPKP